MRDRDGRAGRTGRRWIAGLAPLAAAAALAAGGCGDDDSGSASTNVSTTGSTAISTGKKGTENDIQPFSKFCGDKKVTIAYVDSNAGANPWRKITRAELLDEAKKCPNIEKIIETDGQGSLQKTISDMRGVIAQRPDGIVLMFADFGPSLLPVSRQAMKAGIPVTGILGLGIGGKPGTDYVDVINADEPGDAKVRMAWLNKVLKGKGNIIHVGGTPGNPLSNGVAEGIKASLEEYPGIKQLGPIIDTNFSPADAQKAVAGTLAKYPDIDGVQGECGTCAPGGFRAFEAAKRPLVPWASDDNNEVSCLYEDLKKENPDFQIFTTAARNWLSRIALHKVVAKAQGMANDEPSIYSMPVVEDSTDPKRPPKCVRDAPPGAIFSSRLSDEQVIAAVK